MDKRQVFEAKRKVIITELVEPEAVKFINPGLSLRSPKCSACWEPIGTKRPIAIVWALDHGWRLCWDCSHELEPKEGEMVDGVKE